MMDTCSYYRVIADSTAVTARVPFETEVELRMRSQTIATSTTARARTMERFLVRIEDGQISRWRGDRSMRASRSTLTLLLEAGLSCSQPVSFGLKRLSELCNFLVSYRARGECGVATLEKKSGGDSLQFEI